MTEEAPSEIIYLQKPTQCLLWQHPDRIRIGQKFSDLLEAIESYEDSRYLTRSFYKCRECGQLYFYEWLEWAHRGIDKTYDTFVPVKTQAEIEALKQTDSLSLLSYFPRLQFDGGIGWVGKD
jgi:hypothetical protein